MLQLEKNLKKNISKTLRFFQEWESYEGIAQI